MIFFTKLEQTDLDILDKLQNENNVVVILVSLFYEIPETKQFPRHLIFYPFYWKNRNLFINQIVDVIKNPDYNRFTFNEHLPSFKNRSCLENVKVIPVVSTNSPLHNLYWRLLFYKVFMPMKCQHQQILNVNPLLDKDKNHPYYIGYIPFQKYYELDFEKLTSFLQLEQTGIMNGTQRNVFLSFHNNRKEFVKRTVKLEQLLEANNQTVKPIIMKINFRSTYPHENLIFLHWGNGKEIENIDEIIDFVVDLGCN